MRNSEHTIGPWRKDGWHVRGKDGSIVAVVIPWDVTGCRQEDVDNLSLILAAPEMLESLRKIASIKWGLEGDGGATAIAEEAIDVACGIDWESKNE